MRAHEQIDLEHWIATAGEDLGQSRGTATTTAIRRAVVLLEHVIDADVDDALHVVDGDDEVSAFRILEDLRAVMPVRGGGR